MADDKKPTPPLARPTQGAFEPVEYDFGLGKRIAKHSPNYKRDQIATGTEFNEHDPSDE